MKCTTRRWGELEADSTASYDQRGAARWEAKAYPSMAPLAAWVQELLDRGAFIKHWIDGGSSTVYWIAGFFFPQAFFTGTLQNFARKYTLAIDTCELEYEFQQEGKEDKEREQPEDGVYVYGLKMEGARFDRTSMLPAESFPKDR